MTNNKIKITVLTLIAAISFGIGLNMQSLSASDKIKAKTPKAVVETKTTTESAAEEKSAETSAKTETTAKIDSSLPYTNALTIVANPTKYLNKKVRIRAKFDKFSVLGLDYKPAFKSSEDYITFLIKRDDVINNVVPLSEMKNFMPRKTAEKYIDLKPNDIVEYTGTVFSDALSDTWIDVDSFKIIESKSQEKTSSSK